MDEATGRKIAMIAEITVQRFFTHYLEEVFPEQLERLIESHNNDVTAHTEQIRGAVKAESSRFRIWFMGLLFTVCVGGGVGLAKLVAALTGG